MDYSTHAMVSSKFAADAGWAGLYLTAYTGLAVLLAYLMTAYLARKQPRWEAAAVIAVITLLVMAAVCVKYFVRV